MPEVPGGTPATPPRCERICLECGAHHYAGIPALPEIDIPGDDMIGRCLTACPECRSYHLLPEVSA